MKFTLDAGPRYSQELHCGIKALLQQLLNTAATIAVDATGDAFVNVDLDAAEAAVAVVAEEIVSEKLVKHFSISHSCFHVQTVWRNKK